MRAGARATAEHHAGAERLQKVLADLGVASRREVERWIRAGRLTVNGRIAVLGVRVSNHDQLKLDGRLIRRSAAAEASVIACHRSPGEPLLRSSDERSIAERLPRRAGRRFISVSPMPIGDGGLELLTADGALAARLQRAVRTLESEFSVRVRGELSPEQLAAIRQGALGEGVSIGILALEPSGGEASNRWYRMVALGASGRDVRQLFERQGVAVVRTLRTRLGALVLPRTLTRGQWRELERGEVSALLGSRGSGP